MRTASRAPQYRLAAFGLFCALGLAFGGVAFAQDLRDDGSAIIYTEVPIPTPNVESTPGSTLDRKMEYLTEGKVEDLAQYLGIIYNFLVSIAGVVASVMLIVGGFQYLTSAGDAGKIGAAKKRITDALMGLVLVLGAYTILKSINPDLVTLKLPSSISKVKSELITMPWCDEVEKKTTVVPVKGEAGKCGSVGEYMNGQSRLVCLYRSVCENHLGNDVPAALRDSKRGGALHSQCVQTLTTSAYVNEPFTSDDILFFIHREKVLAEYKAKNGPLPDFPDTPEGAADWKAFRTKNLMPLIPPFGTVVSSTGLVESFARCMSCLEYGAVEKKREPGLTGFVYQTPHEGRCQYWQSEANGGIGFGAKTWTQRKEMNQPLISYCRWMEEERGCAQADFECHEPISENGCGAYDNIKPFYMFDTVRGGYVWWIYGSGKNGTLASRPDALQNVCLANPCGYNLPKGCTGEGGVINGVRTVAAIVRDGISGIQACVNK